MTPHASVINTALNADKRKTESLVSVTNNNSTLKLTANTKENSAMRSIINSYVRLIDLSIKLLEVK